MRVGEILLEHGWVAATSLERAISEQRHTRKRLCSLLIARGLLEPDHAARALGEQHGCAAVLQKHLEHRDRSLECLLPAPLARANIALPLGRKRTGEVIVCVRDLLPGVLAAIRRAVSEPVEFAIAPAYQLEVLVAGAYQERDADEHDVDLTTGPIATLGELDIEIDTGQTPRVAPADALDALSLVDLDDHAVAKDYSQAPPVISRTATPPPMRSSLASLAVAVQLPDVLASLAAATTRDEVTSAAMTFVMTRWRSSLLLTIKEPLALGHRGHGTQLAPDVIASLTIPLAVPSLVKLAYDARQVATSARPGAMQDRLAKLLGHPVAPRAVPIVVGRRVALVLVVGDAYGDSSVAASDLERLAHGLGETYARLVR